MEKKIKKSKGRNRSSKSYAREASNTVISKFIRTEMQEWSDRCKSEDIIPVELEEVLYSRKTWRDRLNASHTKSTEKMENHEQLPLPSVFVRYEQHELLAPQNMVYREVRTLFRNSNSHVALVQHERGGLYVAKILNKQGLSLLNEQRFRREYETLGALSHPNLVRMVEVIENPYQLAIVQEYCDAGDLVQFIERSPARSLPEALTKTIVWEVCKCLLDLHLHGFAHRDVKAENIFLRFKPNAQIHNRNRVTWAEMQNFSNNFDVVVGDLGFSTKFDSNFVMKESVGTLYYASPEIVTRNRTYFGPELDIWSLGVLIYVLINGAFPFRGRTDEESKNLIRQGVLRSNPNFSADLISLFAITLEVRRNVRANIVEVMLQPWFDSLRESDDKFEERLLSKTVPYAMPMNASSAGIDEPLPAEYPPSRLVSSACETRVTEVVSVGGEPHFSNSKISTLRRKLKLLRSSVQLRHKNVNADAPYHSTPTVNVVEPPASSRAINIPHSRSNGGSPPNEEQGGHSPHNNLSPLIGSPKTSGPASPVPLVGVSIQLQQQPSSNSSKAFAKRRSQSTRKTSYQVDINLVSFLKTEDFQGPVSYSDGRNRADSTESATSL